MTNRLLMIDDDEDLTVIYARVAQSAGYETVTTSDPDEFWAAVANWSPTLIIVDLRMPRCDGIEILRGLAERQMRTPVLLSSGTDGPLLETTMRLGVERGLTMKGALAKPLDPAELRAVLERMRNEAGPVTASMLQRAIESDELRLEYQPKVDLRTGRPVGVEALVRWQRATCEVFPADFVPLAEQSGMADALTSSVIDQALRQMATWSRQGLSIPVAVNVSPVNLRSLRFPDEIGASCDALGIDPTLFALELTETAAHDDPTLLADILTRLRLRDLCLSIDDFGTGHSSLMKLHRLPFSELKLDRSFIVEARTSTRARLIIRSTIDLAHSLDMTVVAEGIEDAETARLLAEMGCDLGQGFQFFRPMPAGSVPAVFGSWGAAASLLGHVDRPGSIPAAVPVREPRRSVERQLASVPDYSK